MVRMAYCMTEAARVYVAALDMHVCAATVAGVTYAILRCLCKTHDKRAPPTVKEDLHEAPPFGELHPL